MRPLILVPCLTLLALTAACGQGGTEAGPAPAPTGTDVRGATGTAPPDGSGRPGTTLPDLPADSPEARNASTPDPASN